MSSHRSFSLLWLASSANLIWRDMAVCGRAFGAQAGVLLGRSLANNIRVLTYAKAGCNYGEGADSAVPCADCAPCASCGTDSVCARGGVWNRMTFTVIWLAETYVVAVAARLWARDSKQTGDTLARAAAERVAHEVSAEVVILKSVDRRLVRAAQRVVRWVCRGRLLRGVEAALVQLGCGDLATDAREVARDEASSVRIRHEVPQAVGREDNEAQLARRRTHQ